jgi:hypothetical protein
MVRAESPPLRIWGFGASRQNPFFMPFYESAVGASGGVRWFSRLREIAFDCKKVR